MLLYWEALNKRWALSLLIPLDCLDCWRDKGSGAVSSIRSVANRLCAGFCGVMYGEEKGTSLP